MCPTLDVSIARAAARFQVLASFGRADGFDGTHSGSRSEKVSLRNWLWLVACASQRYERLPRGSDKILQCRRC